MNLGTYIIKRPHHNSIYRNIVIFDVYHIVEYGIANNLVLSVGDATVIYNIEILSTLILSTRVVRYNPYRYMDSKMSVISFKEFGVLRVFTNQFMLKSR